MPKKKNDVSCSFLTYFTANGEGGGGGGGSHDGGLAADPAAGGGGGGEEKVEGVNLNTLRTFRVLRPLKLVSGVPSKRKKNE